MSSMLKVLVLSAGRGIGLDGFHKLKLVFPGTSETILERYMRQLGEDLTVVVGYRAPELMASYPQLDYRYNYNWFETGSAFSAGLGLREAPVIVVPSDLFISEEAANQVIGSRGNIIFTMNTENRSMNAVNVSISEGRITDIYTGPKRRGEDVEYANIVRIEDADLLAQVAESCRQNPHAAFSDCLAMHKEAFSPALLCGKVHEINSVEDYIELFETERRQ